LAAVERSAGKDSVSREAHPISAEFSIPSCRQKRQSLYVRESSERCWLKQRTRNRNSQRASESSLREYAGREERGKRLGFERSASDFSRIFDSELPPKTTVLLMLAETENAEPELAASVRVQPPRICGCWYGSLAKTCKPRHAVERSAGKDSVSREAHPISAEFSIPSCRHRKLYVRESSERCWLKQRTRNRNSQRASESSLREYASPSCALTTQPADLALLMNARSS
jgi:hypothetical protein